MSEKLETVGFPLNVEGTMTGECIIFDDLEDTEEEVLYINSDKCSISCQTEPFDCDTVDYICLPRIPIFFCAQLGSNSVATQCLIPTLVNVAVGTDSSQSCLMSQPEKWDPPDNGGDSALQMDKILRDIDFKVVNTPAFSDTDEKPALALSGTRVKSSQSPSKYEVTEIPGSEGGNVIVSHLALNTSKVKKKRGRKKKVCPGILDRNSESKHTIASQAKPSSSNMGKRKRKRKRDKDYEYDLRDSDDEMKFKLAANDDDRDADYKIEKEVISSDEEDLDKISCNKTELSEIKDLALVTISEKVTIKAENEDGSEAVVDGDVKEEVERDSDFDVAMDDVAMDDVAMDDVAMDDVAEEFDDLSEFDECEVDSDDDGTCDNLLSGQEGRSNILTVGINDLDPENDHSKRLKKYLTRAKEKYHQEKVVKDDGKVMYKCLKCNEEFKMRLQLKEHRKTHSNKVRIYDCSHCDKVFTEARKYYSHLGFHDRLFKCRLCSRRFSLLGNLKKHLAIHEDAPNQVCEVCGSQFVTAEELKLHHETQHNEDSIRAYKIECKHCGRKYVREEAYNQHISKAPYNCSMCDASMGCEFKLKDHVRYQHGRCVCEFCGKSFKKRSLIHHIKVVHREGCVQCPHCPKKFAYRSKMLAHLDANHTEEKKYKCNQCNYTARTVNTLNLHRRKYHSEPGTMPCYGCNLCGRKFYLPSKLTLHYRMHTGEKPYKCGSCGKDFASKYNMAEHERCVHGEKVRLVHPDGSSSVRVVKHRRSPRAPGRRCDLCGLHLPSSSAVVAHMKKHHNAQAVSSISLVADKDESQVAEIELNREENYEVTGEQYEVMENNEQDLILTAPSGIVTIPEYATHVEIDGVEYQVLRQ